LAVVVQVLARLCLRFQPKWAVLMALTAEAVIVKAVPPHQKIGEIPLQLLQRKALAQW